MGWRTADPRKKNLGSEAIRRVRDTRCAGTCGGSRNLVAERSALNRAGHKGYPKEYSGSINSERVLFHSVENSLKTSGPKKPRKHKSTLPGCQLEFEKKVVMAVQEVKVKVVYEDGYEKRFTDCCLSVLRRSKAAKAQENRYPGKKEKAQKAAVI